MGSDLRDSLSAALPAHVEDARDQEVERGLELIGFIRVAEQRKCPSDCVGGAQLAGMHRDAQTPARRCARDGDEGESVQAGNASGHASRLSPVTVEDDERRGAFPGEGRRGHQLGTGKREEHAILGTGLPQRDRVRGALESGVVDHFTVGKHPVDEIAGIALTGTLPLVADDQEAHRQLEAGESRADAETRW